jgi:hypothetical protein
MKDIVHSNNLIEVTYRSDKIIHLHYLTDDMTLENSKEILKFTRLHSPWKLSPILLTGGDFISQDKESREFNGSTEVIQYCSAIAFLSDSLAKKILANFFISINKEKIPMKFFKTEEEAFKWLSQFKTVSNEGITL